MLRWFLPNDAQGGNIGGRPVSNKTSATPGDTPASNKPAATGVEAVAQIYIGTPTSIITSMATMPEPHCARKSGGSKVCTSAANNKPTSSHSTMSSSIWVKA
ncbi:MAG: hypothetical protein HZT40_00020 [Candidatus Thiothrix singaporensis]|uniref:Uncharacterized protein n=1 Tax=Candidatus Thiothrix singaporensis TaxID=2799669 RepID=A0A7L6AMA4_9GAMM|nr:MAG: hypothetical protein HZT40_00020 [Candidatus Thiothrix singaporensis]